MPEAVNAQSSAGHTPLLIAFRLHNLQAAKALIDAGADQTACDLDGQNVLHHLLALISNKGHQQESSYVPEPAIKKHYNHMRSLMDLLDPSLIPTLCRQQTSAARQYSFTPLASWLYHVGTGNACLVAVTRIVLDYSKGAKLEVLDSMGQTPLHRIVDRNTPPTPHTLYALAALLLDCRPELVVRENISGKTPLELAGDAALRAKCRYRKPRREHGDQDWRKYREGFSIAHTPEASFMERNPVDFDDFGGREMAESLLSGATDPNSDGDLRIESLWRLFNETKATLDAEGLGKWILEIVTWQKCTRSPKAGCQIIQVSSKP